MEWTRINPAGNGPGPRYAHNAVMVGNSSLFILFGLDGDNNSQDDFHILDVSNWTWTQSFSVAQSSNVSDFDNSTNASGAASLTGGAIAGIVIGCVAAAAIAGGLVAFLVVRKSRHNSKEYERELQRQNEYQAFHDDNDHSPPPPRYNHKFTIAEAGVAEAAETTTEHHNHYKYTSGNNIRVQHLHPPNESIAASSEDDASTSFKPDVALNLKPDTVEDDYASTDVQRLKFKPMRPDDE